MQHEPTPSAASDQNASNQAGAASQPSASSDGMPSPAQVRQMGDAAQSKLKRTACVLCRKRKLKCDGARPACGTCDRLGHDCKYDEVRKKSGPKRGYVKALEARLAQVETMLKTQDSADSGGDHYASSYQDLTTIGMADPADLSNMNHPDIMHMEAFANAGQSAPRTEDSMPQPTSADSGFDMISLGLEEPLPTSDITQELYQIYFVKVNASLPMIHKARFWAAMNLAPQMRPPVCLRYAMWALAASTSDKFDTLQAIFYQRARKYLEIDEMRGFGQSILTLAHCQAWMLVAMYEFKNMFFPRAWMSTGRAIRLTQMLGLHRLDGTGLDVKMTVPPPRDWTEREERRRTFWLVYWADRCASIGTGWPMSFEEKDILTNLPAPDDNFQNSRPTRTITLAEALQSIDRDFSSTSGIVLMATLFGRNLTHLHRPEPDDNEEDLNGKFWERHRSIDAILLNIKLTLPDHLRIPLGIADPNVVFLNMCLHASAICLHQAAIFKAEKHRMPMNVAGESKMRCIAAASEIATIMRTVSHMDLIQMNPFTSFCLYVAARVFVQFLRARPNEQQVSNSLQFLLTAMHAMTRKNPLTESFIAQLELDMESAGIPNPQKQRGLDKVRARGVPEYTSGNGNPNAKASGSSSGGASCPGMYPTNQGQTTHASPGTSEHSGSIQLSMRQSAEQPLSSSQNPVQGDREIPFGHTHDGGLFPWNNTQAGGDPMDLTPEGSGHTYLGQPSGQKAAAAAAAVSATTAGPTMTPPRSDHESPFSDGTNAQSQASAQRQGSTASAPLRQQQSTHDIADPPEVAPTATSYGFPGQYAQSSNSGSGQTPLPSNNNTNNPMNMEDFSQFLAMTPGLSNAQLSTDQLKMMSESLPTGWENMSFPGMTPGATTQEQEDFQKMMESVTGWEGGEPLVQDQWYTNGPG